ncbi:MAG TPA: SMC-Scp complex subunit ScpB [Ruminococcus sp.]|nr:SMC-Scp complex subunit ScpB [Ruminococcus sp.]
MEIERLTTLAEAVLFASGDPVETSRLALTLKISEKELIPIMEHLQERYTKTESALQVMRFSKSWQLGTRPEFAFVIREAMEKKRMQPLSNAAMETLTIIAYNQPVSKGFVERIRGIDSSSVVNSLVDKGLLEEAGRIDVPGHPIGYRTTPLFLRVFGISSLDELPDPNARQEDKFTGELDGYSEIETESEPIPPDTEPPEPIPESQEGTA